MLRVGQLFLKMGLLNYCALPRHWKSQTYIFLLLYIATQPVPKLVVITVHLPLNEMQPMDANLLRNNYQCYGWDTFPRFIN